MAPELFLHKRVAEELKHHPPFSELEDGALLILAENTEVIYVNRSEALFNFSDALAPYIYVVAEGTIELWRDDLLIDQVDRGEMLGLRTIFESGTYKATAKPKAGHDALVYAFPKSLAKSVLVDNPLTEHFFQLDWKGDRDGFIPSGTSLRRLMKRKGQAFELPISDEQRLLEVREAITIAADQSIQEAARRMNEAKTDAIVVTDPHNIPLGIITDSDLRKHVALPHFHQGMLSDEVMTHPLHTFSQQLSYTDALVAMVEHRFHHLVITENGGVNEPLVGIISDHDILLEQALNPTIIIKKMDKAPSLAALEKTLGKVEQLRANYVEADTNSAIVQKVMTQCYSGLYRNAIRLVQKEIGPPPCAYTWIALGSLGRGEQLIITDQDHALVYEQDACAPYMADMAEKVSGIMTALGFEEDHYGVSASNPQWRGTPTQWKKRFVQWCTEGEGDALLALGIILDATVIDGEVNLSLPVFNALYQQIQLDEVLMKTMAADALRNPSPLNFFKQLKLESTGVFDLKLRGILPFIDASKVLALKFGKGHIAGTSARLEAIKNEGNKDLITSAIHAYEITLYLRVKFSKANNNDGRYINPNALDSLDRQLLRNVLKTLEALQDHVKLQFSL